MADFMSNQLAQARAADARAADRAQWVKARAERVPERRDQQAVEYHVEIVRSKIVGDRVDHDEVGLAMNDLAADGWRFCFAVETQVLARIGPGGMGGLMLFFERPGPAAGGPA